MRALPQQDYPRCLQANPSDLSKKSKIRPAVVIAMIVLSTQEAKLMQELIKTLIDCEKEEHHQSKVVPRPERV